MGAANAFTLNGELTTAAAGQTILQAARGHGVEIPTLCYLEGLTPVAACRLCLVEVAGSNKLQPACMTPVQDGMSIVTHSERLTKYRRMIVEMLFSERNHVCSVCVSNGHCELQDQAYAVGMTNVRFDYLCPDVPIDATHERFVADQNRCILCTRCVRVCDEVEGAHTWDVMARGVRSRVITDLCEPWGESSSCTSCGKCVEVCPTGALFEKHASAGEMVKHPEMLRQLEQTRESLDGRR